MASRTLIVILLCLLPALRLAGAGSADNLNGMLDNSPFGVSRAGAAAASGTNDPLEFRSVSEEKGTKFFSIYETATHRSTWVELNEPVNGFSIKGYDAAHENVTVEYHNKTMTLPIKRGPVVAQAALPVSAGLPPGTVSNAGASGQSDAQRLQQIQEEIRRRRALRQQPMLPTGAPSGPQPLPAGSSGSLSGPQAIPAGNPGSLSGPQPTPLPPGSAAGPQPIPASNPGSLSGPQLLPPKP